MKSSHLFVSENNEKKVLEIFKFSMDIPGNFP